MMPRALLIGGCSRRARSRLSRQQVTRSSTKIKVAFLAAEPAALVTYAKHRGMFTKQGIDAEMVPRTDPQLLLAALLSGDVQFSGAHAGAAALLKSRGAPIKVVAAGALYEPKNPTSALVAAEGQDHQAPPRPRRQDDPDRRPQHDRAPRRPQVAEAGRRLKGRREDQLRPVSGHARLAVQGRSSMLRSSPSRT